MEFTSRYAIVDGMTIHVLEAGPPHADAVLLSHGFARTARDFQPLAQRLAGRWRVLVPDMIGRGLSDWSAEPRRDYCLARYASLSVGLLDVLGVARVRWVGTSMGGTIGIRIAGDADPGRRARIAALVLNDTGPVRAATAIDRIRRTFGEPPRFATVAELESYLRVLYAACGAMSDAGWRALAERTLRRTDDGRFTLQHDPRVVAQFDAHPEDLDLWQHYDRATARTLCLRGVLSDLLSVEVATAMTVRGPRAQVIDVPDVGHAPNLDTVEQMDRVAAFLES